jgi:hypothetical protein
MLFRGLRAGDEVILATPAGRGAGGSFTYALAEVEAVKSALVVVAGYKFNLKDGKGRTVPHHILPATPANRQEYLGGEADSVPAAVPAEAGAEDRQRALALDALRVIRESDPANDDDLIDLIGAETLIAFRRQWRKLQPEGESARPPK